MDRIEVVTFLERILEGWGERVAITEFTTEFSKTFNIIDSGAIKRKLNSFEKLGLIVVTPHNDSVWITHKGGKIE